MKVKTHNNLYTVLDMGDGGFMISGHAVYCPNPTLCTLHRPIREGSSMIFVPVSGQFSGLAIITSPVVEIKAEATVSSRSHQSEP